MPRKINDYATKENSFKAFDLLATYGVSSLYLFTESD